MNSHELAEQLLRLEGILAAQANEYDRLESDIEEHNRTIEEATAKIQENVKRKAALEDSVAAGKISMQIINTFVKQSILKADVGAVLDDLRTQVDPDLTAAYTKLGIEPMDDREGEATEEQQELDVSTG